MLVDLIFVEVEVVVLLRSPRVQGLSLKTLHLLPLKHDDSNSVRTSWEEDSVKPREDNLLPGPAQVKERSLLSW